MASGREIQCKEGLVVVAVIDEVGNRYGRLVVIERAGSIRKHAAWLCECDCGNKTIVSGVPLRDGRTQSCGCIKEEWLGKLPEGEAAFHSLLDNYKRNAEKRDISFDLSEEEFRALTEQDCHYCGSHPLAIHKSSGCNGSYIYNGIDRIDNDRGYTQDNCVPCCKFCNRAKGWDSTEEFLAYLDRVVEHRGSK